MEKFNLKALEFWFFTELDFLSGFWPGVFNISYTYKFLKVWEF